MPLNSNRRRKLSELLPEGIITDSSWLIDNGFARHPIDNMVKSGVLTPLRHGVYIRGSVPLTWEAVVYSLQYLFKTDLAIGGLTALELRGYTHYIPMSKKSQVHLYGTDKMPTWLNTLLPDVTFIWHHEKDLAGRRRQSFNSKILDPHAFTTERNWRDGFPGLLMSRPEKAILEVLLDVPEKISFDHADQLVLGLATLSPSILQKLLEATGNVKVKRLFFLLADRHKYAWLPLLNKGRVDFGHGNRMLIKGGKLDKQYRISVPKDLVSSVGDYVDLL